MPLDLLAFCCFQESCKPSVKASIRASRLTSFLLLPRIRQKPVKASIYASRFTSFLLLFQESGKPEAHMTIKKVFVGGIKAETTEDDLRAYFSEFGNVTLVEIIMDKETNKNRGFCFVSFDDYDPVDKVVLKRHHSLLGKKVDVKKAVSKEEQSKMGQRSGMRG